jgi:uncharacterized phage infection (PIP) family protein YhgE
MQQDWIDRANQANEDLQAHLRQLQDDAESRANETLSKMNDMIDKAAQALETAASKIDSGGNKIIAGADRHIAVDISVHDDRLTTAVNDGG